MHPVPLFLYDTVQNVPWVIPIRLFTCKFKYGRACTDKTLPRSFLTHLLLTSTARTLDPPRFRTRQKSDAAKLKNRIVTNGKKKLSVFVWPNVYPALVL